MRKIRVIVCGVHFGKFYIEACKKNNRLELQGILSQGSIESYNIADKNNIPLYTKPKDIMTNNVDMIVMATRSLITGGRSNFTVKELLRKGISVIQEQPVHEKEVLDICRSINVHKQGYYVNNFYRFLPNARKFISYARKLIDQYKIIRLQFSCSSQVLYPLIDTLYEILGDIKEFSVEKLLDGNMEILSGTINYIPFVLNYYNEYSEDNDGNLALFFDIKVDSDAGNLRLTDPEGEIIWESHLCYEKNFNMSKDNPGNIAPIEILSDKMAASYVERYEEVWPQAMGKSLVEFFDKSLNEKSEALIKRTLKQCEVCTNIIKTAGKPKKLKTPYLHGISMRI